MEEKKKKKTSVSEREASESAPENDPAASSLTATASTDPNERPMLEVDGLVKSYGGRTVVDSVSFTVRSGEIIGLLGKNGAGKTTTFRMTIGMIGADEGS